MTQQKIILELIKDHITHTRLSMGLYQTGFDIDNIDLNLGNTIFEIMGLGSDKESDEKFTLYLDIIDKISDYDREQWQDEVEPLAREAYALLIQLGSI